MHTSRCVNYKQELVRRRGGGVDKEIYSFLRLKPRPCFIYCESLYEQNLIMRYYD